MLPLRAGRGLPSASQWYPIQAIMQGGIAGQERTDTLTAKVSEMSKFVACEHWTRPPSNLLNRRSRNVTRLETAHRNRIHPTGQFSNLRNCWNSSLEALIRIDDLHSFSDGFRLRFKPIPSSGIFSSTTRRPANWSASSATTPEPRLSATATSPTTTTAEQPQEGGRNGGGSCAMSAHGGDTVLNSAERCWPRLAC